MFYYQAIASYKGSQYYGWQTQKDETNRPSIQGTIHLALRKVAKYQDCGITAAGRTDAGVHAKNQLIKITLPLEIEANKLKQGLNSLLPPDIRISEVTKKSENFSPSKIIKHKTYHYYFAPIKNKNPLFNDIIYYYDQELNIELMKEGAKLFEGKHDFKSFSKIDSTISSSKREILSCDICSAKLTPFGQDIFYIEISGEGFLKHMVRYIANTLFSLGQEKISLHCIQKELESPSKKLASKAPPHGLCLESFEFL